MHKGHNTAYESIGWIAGIAIRGGVLCATHLRSDNYYVRVGECVVATGVRALFVQLSNVSRLAKISNSLRKRSRDSSDRNHGAVYRRAARRAGARRERAANGRRRAAVAARVDAHAARLPAHAATSLHLRGECTALLRVNHLSPALRTPAKPRLARVRGSAHALTPSLSCCAGGCASRRALSLHSPLRSLLQ